MGQQWERSLFCQFQLLGSYWKVHWLKLAPGLKKVQWGKLTPPNIFFRPILPNFEKKLKSETMILGGGPCSQSVSHKPRSGQNIFSNGGGGKRSKIGPWGKWNLEGKSGAENLQRAGTLVAKCCGYASQARKKHLRRRPLTAPRVFSAFCTLIFDSR